MINRSRLAVRLQDVKPGGWFLPVSAEGKDQHFLIPEALGRGAAGFVYEEGHFDPSPFAGTPSVGVSDLRAYLFQLAKENRARLRAQVAVVAGSYGKSSVKEMVASILNAGEKPGSFHCSPANWNTKPLLAAQMAGLKKDCRLAVFEIGARREGDFAIPLGFLRPDLVCLLNIGRAHLGEFGSPAALEKTKLSALQAPSARTLVVPRDHGPIHPRALSLGREIISFGSHEGSDLRLVEDTENKVELSYRSERIVLEIAWHAPGRGTNLAAASAIALGLGQTWQAVKYGLENYRPLPGRFERRNWRGRLVVNDAYNSSPESLLAGVSEFSRLRGSAKAVFVLGSMLELGARSQEIHEELGRLLPGFQRPGDWLLTVGGEAEPLGNAARSRGWLRSHHCVTPGEAQTFLEEKSESWSAAYIKGSKAVGLQGILGRC